MDIFSLLIVDDEIHSVEGVKEGIHWESLNVTCVHTALSMRQAKEIFNRNRVDIMLCDIEMPQGSGLELLSWVRENYPKTECIILTCHAEFVYAKQAMQMGSLDYILKPVPYKELEAVVAKAVNKSVSESKRDEYSQYGQLWIHNHPLLVERFWLDILSGKISPNFSEIKKAAEKLNFSCTEQMRFLPILIHIKRWYDDLSRNKQNTTENSLKKLSERIILQRGTEGHFLELNERALLGIILFDNRDTPDINLLEKLCDSLIRKYHHDNNCDLSCYIGNKVHGQELPLMVDNLFMLEKNNVVYNNKVFFLQNQSNRWSSELDMPDMELWSILLIKGKKDKIITEVTTYLNNLSKSTQLNADMLNQFYQDFNQMIYTTLKQKGIQAHQLYCDHVSKELSDNAVCSVSDMNIWVTHIIKKGIEYACELEESKTAVEKVKEFILSHMNQDIKVRDIADYVHLNPDYLTRIFKKETGLTLMEYYSYERIKKAMDLLDKADMQVSAVAKYLGYTNFSYFSKIFRKYTHMSPIDYRKRHHK